MTWTDRAACADLDPDEADRVFFSLGATSRAARRYCHACPVLAACRAAGDREEPSAEARHLYGYRAGETPQERRDRRTA